MRVFDCARISGCTAVAVACVATVFMTGCTSIRSEVYQDPSVDFSQLRTFSWVSERTATAGDSRLNSEFLEARIPVMVGDQLAGRRVVENAGENPSFLLDYRVRLEAKEGMAGEGPEDDDPQLVGWRRNNVKDWEMTDPDGYHVRFYEEGSLLLVARDPQSQKMIWQGVARIEVDPEMTSTQKEALLKRAISLLLKKFPVGDMGK
jgi:hypothetical protein